MNTDRLSKYYPQLEVDERFSLLVAAGVRGDEVEIGRIADAAKKLELSVPDTFGRTVAMFHIAAIQRAVILERCGSYFLAFRPSTKNSLDADRMQEAAMLIAYLIRVEIDGLDLFCRRVGVLREFFEEGLPGADLIKTTVSFLEKFPGFDEAEALSFIRQSDPTATEVRTAESVAEDLMESFKKIRAI